MRGFVVTLLLVALLLVGCRPSREIQPSISFQKFFEDTNRLGYLFAMQAATIDFKMLQHRWPNHSAEVFPGALDSITKTSNWLTYCEIVFASDSLTVNYILRDSLPPIENNAIEFLDMDSVKNLSGSKIETEGYFDMNRDEKGLEKGELVFKQLNDSVFKVSHRFEGGWFTNKFIWKEKMIKSD